MNKNILPSAPHVGMKFGKTSLPAWVVMAALGLGVSVMPAFAVVDGNSNVVTLSSPTVLETYQDIFFNETPYFSYRLGGIAQKDNMIIVTATAFKSEKNSDGLLSDIIYKRSFDGGKTWSNATVLIENNAITTNSRVYNESLVLNEVTDRLHLQYVSIDTEGNLTAIYPNHSYVTDTLGCYSDDWDNQNATPTWSKPVSLLAGYKKDLTEYPYCDMVLPGPGNGIQTANGKLIFFGYSMFSIDDIKWRQNPLLIVSDNDGVTWTARNQPIGIFGNESGGYEDGDNIIEINTRWGSGTGRRIARTIDFGVHYKVPSYNRAIPSFGCFGGVAKIPANGTTRASDIYMYSNITSSKPSRNSIRVDASIDRVNYTNGVYYLTDYPSDGYSNIVYNGQYLLAYFESADGNIGFVNLTEKIREFYDAAVLITP